MTTAEYRTRLILYAFIAAITALLTDLSAISGEQILTMREWVIITLKTVLASAVTVRAFIDKSTTNISTTNIPKT